MSDSDLLVKAVIQTSVSYRIYYTYPWCFDSDSYGPGDHDLNWSETVEEIKASTDEEAQLVSLEDRFHRPERCQSHPQRRAYPIMIEKTVIETTSDRFERRSVTEVPLPRSSQCACGRVYWPVRKEQACHELSSIKE